MKTILPSAAVLFAGILLVTPQATAQVPQMINYQGRIATGITNFNGTGQFRFALVNSNGSTTYWSNSSDFSPADGVPDTAVSLTVTKGLYSVLLGSSMNSIPSSVFANPDVRLRVWFNDGVNGNQLLSPDQRITSVGYAMIADGVTDGAITSAKIAAGAVGTNQLSQGAVDDTKLATGAVTANKLNLGAAAGTIWEGGISTVPGTLTFTATYPVSFPDPPALSIFTQGWTQSSATTTGFSATMPFSTTVVDSTGDVGKSTSVAIVNGFPAIAYFDFTNSSLKYVRATNAAGTAWGTPVTIDTAGSAFEAYQSLVVVNGIPAICYYRSSPHSLKYVRANNANGTSWGAPITLATNAGQYCSMAIVNGNPAISYLDSTNTALAYIRATNNTGTTWGSPVIVSNTGLDGFGTKLLVANGNPAIRYANFSDFQVHYVRANDSNGATWSTPLTISIGDAFSATSPNALPFAIVNGVPAIACYDYYHGDMVFVQATNADGTAWDQPVVVENTGNTVGDISLAVINGNPAFCYYDSSTDDLKIVRATDPNGTAWAPSSTLDSGGDVGSFNSMTVIDDNPVISYYDVTNHDLKALALPNLQWSATDGTVAPVVAMRVRDGAIDSSQLSDSLMLGGTTNGTFSGNGASLTSLNAGNVSSGTLADARLSTNVALKNAVNTFSAANTFSSASNNFSGNGGGLTNLNATNLAIGTIADSLLSANVPLKNAANTLTATNTFSFSGTNLAIRFDSSVVPGINVTGGGNPGIMRLRNALEIWPSDDATRSGKLDVRNSGGTATVTLDGSNGSIATTGNAGIGGFAVVAASTIAPANGATVTPTTGYTRLNPSGAVTLNATTAISDGSSIGQMLIVEVTTNSVTLNDNANLQLSNGSNVTLSQNDTLTLLWNGADWIQVAFTNN